MVLQIFSRKPVTQRQESKPSRSPVADQDVFQPAEPLQLASDPLTQCVQLGRWGHLLANRHMWKDRSEIERVCRSTRQRIDEMFAIVPEGYASLSQTITDEPGCPEVTIETEPFLLARHTVTNSQYQMFVDAGGYEQMELWPMDIWPHLIDFKDLTGEAGPKFFQGGRHSKHLAKHPVVGVCHYEAAAYAKWAGYRLPTEAEWQMTATWCIRSAANVLRRYPWGDALDTKRCNIWASGYGRTIPAEACPEGATPNHILQLVGNVWEWTAGDFEVSHGDRGMVVGDMTLSSIRGGAFDTYFPSQATSFFRTGLASLARTHNAGFRCAISLEDEVGTRMKDEG